jgi:hypothetical protein
MRAIIVACLMLAGCAQPDGESSAAVWREANRDTPAGRADIGCRSKVQFALAGMQRTSFLDLERDARANQLHATCMDYWRRTGQLP